MGVTTQIDNNKQSLALNISQEMKLEAVKVEQDSKVLLQEHDGSWRGHDGHVVTLNCGVLWAVGGSSSLLGRPTFSLNMPTISAFSTISAISTIFAISSPSLSTTIHP